MNWFKRHLTSSILIGCLLWLGIALSIMIWVSEIAGRIVFAVVPVAFIAYGLGHDIGFEKGKDAERKKQRQFQDRLK